MPEVLGSMSISVSNHQPSPCNRSNGSTGVKRLTRIRGAHRVHQPSFQWKWRCVWQVRIVQTIQDLLLEQGLNEKKSCPYVRHTWIRVPWWGKAPLRTWDGQAGPETPRFRLLAACRQPLSVGLGPVLPGKQVLDFP